MLRIEGAAGGVVTSGEEVLIEPAGEWPVVVGGWRRYRGRVRARAVGNETLVINELNMESYLKGVVPVEMGPSQFPELDALKAQAVAARTYAVAHLGDHDDEGWDLCATPACQAYYGRSAEHSLSNRAVDETAGLVAAYLGQPIDAMYTSTCGGHTEDAAVLFEDRAQPYLVGVPCAWERPISLTGTSDPGPWIDSTAFSAAIAREVLGLAPGATPGAILARILEWTGVTAHLLAPIDAETFAASVLAAAGVDPPAGIAPATGGLERLLFLTDLYKRPARSTGRRARQATGRRRRRWPPSSFAVTSCATAARPYRGRKGPGFSRAEPSTARTCRRRCRCGNAGAAGSGGSLRPRSCRGPCSRGFGSGIK